MGDRILTFQQSSVMQDIEMVLDLVKKGAPAFQIKEAFEEANSGKLTKRIVLKPDFE